MLADVFKTSLLFLSIQYVYGQDLYGIKQCESVSKNKYMSCRIECAAKYKIDTENTCNMLFCSYCMDSATLLTNQKCCATARESPFLHQLFTVVCSDVTRFWNCEDPDVSRWGKNHISVFIGCIFMSCIIIALLILLLQETGNR